MSDPNSRDVLRGCYMCSVNYPIQQGPLPPSDHPVFLPGSMSNNHSPGGALVVVPSDPGILVHD